MSSYKYKLSEDDVESWAETYGHHSKAARDAMRVAHKAFLKAVNWSHEASDGVWQAEAAEVCGKAFCAVVDAIGVAGHSVSVALQIERTITGGRKSKRAMTEFERVKNRAVVNEVLNETRKKK